VIEAQQRVLNRKPDHIVIPTAHDRAITMFNRLMDKIASEDSAIASVTA